MKLSFFLDGDARLLTFDNTVFCVLACRPHMKFEAGLKSNAKT